MSRVPAQPKIYDITHVDNLPRIIADGRLLSDATIAAQGGPAVVFGMSEIKRERIEELDVACHPGTKVGDYVPFFFCPRSVMLYVLHRGDNPELTYHGGQDPIVHLEADLCEVIAWADKQRRLWAFSLSNAGAFYAQFRSRLDELNQLNWEATAATDFASPISRRRSGLSFCFTAASRGHWSNELLTLSRGSSHLTASNCCQQFTG